MTSANDQIKIPNHCGSEKDVRKKIIMHVFLVHHRKRKKTEEKVRPVTCGIKELNFLWSLLLANSIVFSDFRPLSRRNACAPLTQNNICQLMAAFGSYEGPSGYLDAPFGFETSPPGGAIALIPPSVAQRGRAKCAGA